MRNRERNLDQLRLAAAALEPLLDRLVFLGGCTTGLFISDAAAADVRPTRDVDVIVEVSGLAEYQALETTLRSIGFAQPMEEDGPVCRWRKNVLIVDVMPTDERILGFGNRWYPQAIRSAERTVLGNNLEIRVVTPVMFVATKLEAFEGRGKGDFYGSHDMEDLVAVIDGRAELVEELRAANNEVRHYIAERFTRYMANTDFNNALPGFSDSPARERTLRERLVKMVEAAS